MNEIIKAQLKQVVIEKLNHVGSEVVMGENCVAAVGEDKISFYFGKYTVHISILSKIEAGKRFPRFSIVLLEDSKELRKETISVGRAIDFCCFYDNELGYFGSLELSFSEIRWIEEELDLQIVEGCDACRAMWLLYKWLRKVIWEEEVEEE